MWHSKVDKRIGLHPHVRWHFPEPDMFSPSGLRYECHDSVGSVSENEFGKPLGRVLNVYVSNTPPDSGQMWSRGLRTDQSRIVWVSLNRTYRTSGGVTYLMSPGSLLLRRRTCSTCHYYPVLLCSRGGVDTG